MKELIQEQIDPNGDTYKTFAEIKPAGQYTHLSVTRGFYSGGVLMQESVPFETFLTDDGFGMLINVLRKYSVST